VQGGNKESSCQQDRRIDLAAFVFPQNDHYPRTGALILFNKIITYLVFSQGFFQGLFTQKSLVQMWLVFVFYASTNVSLIT
jgi:hypothetical protein